MNNNNSDDYLSLKREKSSTRSRNPSQSRIQIDQQDNNQDCFESVLFPSGRISSSAKPLEHISLQQQQLQQQQQQQQQQQLQQQPEQPQQPEHASSSLSYLSVPMRMNNQQRRQSQITTATENIPPSFEKQNTIATTNIVKKPQPLNPLTATLPLSNYNNIVINDTTPSSNSTQTPLSTSINSNNNNNNNTNIIPMILPTNIPQRSEQHQKLSSLRR
jgi:hypothetical protein